MLRESPESATSLGLDVDRLAALRGRLKGRSAAAFAVNHEQCTSRLRALDRFDRGRLSDASRSSYDAVRYAHRLAVDGGR